MASGDPFGVQVKRARERRHITQQELADLLGVDRKTVDNWENNRTYPRNRIGALEQWAPELGEDADPERERLSTALAELREDGVIGAELEREWLGQYDAGKRGAAKRAG